MKSGWERAGTTRGDREPAGQWHFRLSFGRVYRYEIPLNELDCQPCAMVLLPPLLLLLRAQVGARRGRGLGHRGRREPGRGRSPGSSS